jgi:hypothetical protein
MFVAEILALIFYQISQRLQRAKSVPLYSNLVAGDDVPAPKVAPSRRRLYLLLGLPALCDLVGSAVMGIGLLYIDASVWQMLRGALTIFSALLHAFVLKRPQKGHMWIGVVLVTISLVLVGFAAITASDGVAAAGVSTGIVILAMCLTAGSQFLRAVQVVLEDWLVHDIEISPYLIVGAEGVWGMLGTAFIFLPICQNLGSVGNEGNGVHEDTIDTFLMLGSEPLLIGLTILYILAILGLNTFGMILCEFTNAVMRTIIEAMRTLCVWVVQLIFHYTFSKSEWGRRHPEIGEEWSVASWLELAGFILLVTGMFIYNGSLKMPCLSYDRQPDADLQESDVGDRSESLQGMELGSARVPQND